ncbi:self-incompatibility protein S1-like [Papaver somniferum]|uniref:self-incompatibility protein S1-like n=1 Tax=Papaver somniferum TaxID=3469 RepID=UPI000E6F7A83|nr:self-incompatibility protein S1-like [Papaver somniferum]
MNSNAPRCWLLLFIVIVLAVQAESGCYIEDEVTVTVLNKLEDTKTMIIQCRSTDDDLGKQVIPYGELIQWRFKINIAHSTLFYCDVEWRTFDENVGDICNGYHFIVYDAKRDDCRCKRECNWEIKDNGPLGQDEKGAWENFPYEPQTCSAS